MKEEKFKFKIGRKHTVWLRGDVEVKAANEDEAIEKLKSLILNGDLGKHLVNFSIAEDTLEPMHPIENGNNPTSEASYQGDVVLSS